MTYFNPKKEDVKSQVDEVINNVAAVVSLGTSGPVSRAKELLALYHAMPNGLNFELTKALALECVDNILEHWLPDGEQRGRQYVALNPTRGDSEAGSFTINMETGVWSDFATDDKGGDLISSIAYIDGGISQTDAAVKILEFIAGLRADDCAAVVERTIKAKAKPQPEYTAIMPIPTDARARPVFFGPTLGHPTTTWAYRNAGGQAMCYVNRFNTSTGKSFLPLIYAKDVTGHCSWQSKAPPVPRPAYGLDRLAANPNAPVLFNEGEKSADAAQLLFPEFVAVTTMNGAQSPEKTDFSPFVGRKVYIAPDNDDAGTAYTNKLIGLLLAVGAEVVAVLRLEMLVKNGVALAQGYDLADAAADGWTAESLAQLGDALWAPVLENGEAPQPEAKQEFDGMPAHFQMLDDGLYFTKKSKDDDDQVLWICSPIVVAALARSEHSSDWGRLLEFNDADGAKHLWAMPAEMLAGSGQEYREVLLSSGASISTDAYQRAQFGRYLQTCKPIARALSVSQPGWHGQNFVLGDRAFGPSAERVVLQARSPASYAIYAQGGTFEAWKENVAAPAAGNSRLILAICASLTGPVLNLTKEESGGFHYRGRSSTGKSIGMHVGASVWGGRSYLVQWNSTDNGLEATACRYNDMMLGLDEIGEMDPSKAGKVAYMLANGQGKVRADIHADAKVTKKWRLMILSSGEVSLADHMASAGQTIKAGQEIRLVDIPADPGKGFGLFDTIHGATSSADFANTIRENAITHFGHAGTALVTALTDPQQKTAILDDIRTIMTAFKQTYIPVDADGQVVRVGHRFALVAAVGEICIGLGILPWSAGEAINGVNTCYQAWIETRGGTGNLEADQIVAQVRKFLELHGESRFTEMVPEGLGLESNARTINRAGFRKAAENGGTEFFVLPETFKADICQGHDSRYVAQVLSERGFLRIGKDKKPQVTIRLPGIGPKRVYHLLPSIMGEQAEAVEPVAVKEVNLKVVA